MKRVFIEIYNDIINLAAIAYIKDVLDDYTTSKTIKVYFIGKKKPLYLCGRDAKKLLHALEQFEVTITPYEEVERVKAKRKPKTKIDRLREEAKEQAAIDEAEDGELITFPDLMVIKPVNLQSKTVKRLLNATLHNG